ncbi:MAG: fibronectin-like protein, partial [Cryobacterium sp.]|nr:fibronectin-like protein [Cryobacterium sp.]
MSRRWLASHRSLVATATSGTVVAALVATIAVVSGGYTAQRLDLGDSAVWVLNEDRQVVGRANTSVRELNTVVSAGSSRLDIVQQGPTVLVVDRGNSSLDILNPATAELGRSVPLPPADPAVYLADDRVVIAADGDLWSVDAEKLDSFDGTAQPTLSLGAGSVTSMDPEGTFFSFTPTTGNVSRVDADSADTVTSSVRINAGSEDDSYQVTSVNGTWSVLNETSRHLFLPGADVDLSTQIQAGDDPVLQQAAGDGNEVLIAHRGGLLAVPVSGGVVNPVLTDRAGRAAVPLQLDGCSYAAWGDGSTWRSCPAGNGGGESGTVEGIAGDARLEFRVNGTEVILNDARNGTSWAVRQDNARIDNWDDLIDRVHDEHLVEENNDDTPPEFEKTQLSPVAVEDEFGARPGRTAILPVLLNDYDPNGDVVVITELRGLAESEGTVDTVGNNQQVRLSLPAGASGRLSFEYSISDGRGGAASATVAVDVRNDDENSPPTQVRPTHATVQAGGRVTREVLGDWVDPDSDPFFLSAAKAQAPDSASFTPDGALVYSDAGTGGDVKQVALQVSDGQAEGSGTLAVDVRPAGEVPIVTEPFVALATAGVELQVSPLGHVRGGSAAIRLSNVPPKPDVTITPDLAGGEFRFVSNTVGTHYIDYTVTDGHVSAAGIVRVDVKAAPDPSMKPVTVPHTAFVRGQQPTLVDVLATDFDPAGGVLLVSGTPDVPPGSGLRAEVLDQRLIRVTLSRPLEGGTASFSYRVTNGLAEADGVVTVMEIPEPSRKQAPIAAQDSISVRVGDAIDIPVLRNDEHPDQDPLALNPELVSELPAGAGLLFASGDVLRYLAPNKTGNFSAVYRVDAPDGQFATAEVQIAVREADPASNNPPVPKTAVARVIAGQKVDIPITLVGIDPDGDSVQLLGQETNPKKGAVTDVGPDSVEYEAGAYSSGTDTFTYTVVDALGARAIGVVRVGISARQDGARNPVAVADEVTARPGSSVAVRVLANDSDPDGGTLKLTGVEASVPGTGAAGIDGDIITVTTPSSEGRFGFIYEVRNERGGTSSNFLTVIVEENAPLSRPDARDTVLALSDVLDRSTIDVDVLANVFFADGPVRELGLRLMPGYSGSAVVTASHRIRVTLGDHKQIVPFRVAHPDDPAVSSYAFIWVPGYEDALPQLRRGAPRLSVPSESTLTIDINKFVVAVGGRNVRLTDASTVRATNSDGAPTAADSDTLVFTSADRYYGPASISFEVTDGSSADNRTGRTATIVLPITVTPRENQPPALENAAIDFEPDQVKVLDLVRLTTYPYPDDQRELEYSVLEPRPSGFTWSLDGSSLTVQADETTPKGTVDSLTIGVRDGVNEGRAGRIEMRVVASTRPIAIPSPDNVTAARGQTTLVDVLANDGAADPFPAVPLR